MNGNDARAMTKKKFFENILQLRQKGNLHTARSSLTDKIICPQCLRYLPGKTLTKSQFIWWFEINQSFGNTKPVSQLFLPPLEYE